MTSSFVRVEIILIIKSNIQNSDDIKFAKNENCHFLYMMMFTTLSVDQYPTCQPARKDARLDADHHIPNV